MTSIEVTTADGPCPVRVFEPPSGEPPHPAVLFFMDGVGPRPALYGMCLRLAAEGYVVALPDVFHRSGAYEPDELMAAISDPDKRSAWRDRFFNPATKAENAKADAQAVFDYFDSRPDVRKGRYGTTGYCMGGFLSLSAAGHFPDRVAAAASFHGGFLASDAPASPHRLAAQMKAKVYVGCATDDPSFPDAMKQRLADALTEAKVSHQLETYAAAHGFAIADFPTYDEKAAERHWEALLSLFESTLKAALRS